MRYAPLHKYTHTHTVLSDTGFPLPRARLKAQQSSSCSLCGSSGVVVQPLIHNPNGGAMVGRLHSFPPPCRAYHKAERKNLQD